MEDRAFEIFETKERVQADNAKEAEKVRASLKQHHTFLVNLMSSPGAGKTTTLVRTIRELKKDYRIGVMEADVDSDVDAMDWISSSWRMSGILYVRRSLMSGQMSGS